MKTIQQVLRDEWSTATFCPGDGLMLNRICAVCEESIPVHGPYYERASSLTRRWAHAQCVEPDGYQRPMDAKGQLLTDLDLENREFLGKYVRPAMEALNQRWAEGKLTDLDKDIIRMLLDSWSPSERKRRPAGWS